MRLAALLLAAVAADGAWSRTTTTTQKPEASRPAELAVDVVLIQADWTQQKLRDYFLRPLARITNRMSPRGYQTYDWEE